MVGGLWAIYNFRKAGRLEAAKWLKQLFSEFYIDATFAKVRDLLEYHYNDKLGPLIESRITNREIDLSKNERELLRELDTLLNYFEHLLYLQKKRHISRDHLQAVFRYWLDLMREEQRGGQRRYAAKFDFERIARIQTGSPKLQGAAGKLTSATSNGASSKLAANFKGFSTPREIRQTFSSAINSSGMSKLE